MQAHYSLRSDAVSRLCMQFRVAGAVLNMTLRRNLAPWAVGRRGPAVFWQAHYFLHSDAVSRGRSGALCTPMLFHVAGAVLYITLRRLLLAWQAQYFLHSDAVSRGRRSALCTLMLFRTAGTILYITLRTSAAVGRRSSCSRITLCTPMLFPVAGAVLSALRCGFAWQAQYFILPCEGLAPWAAVGRRGAAVFLRGRRRV